MKTYKAIRFFLPMGALFLLAALTWANPAAAAEIRWQNYPEGAALAQKTGRAMMMHFYADWGFYCKLMEKESFRNEQLITYLNENFIPVHVNFEKEKSIARQFEVIRIPTTVLVSGQGHIARRMGFMTGDELIDFLKKFMENSGQGG